MSEAEAVQETDEFDDISKSELVETVRGQAARIERLEDELDELREKVNENGRMKVSKQGVNFLVNDLVGGGVEDFTADPFEYRELVQEFNDQFGNVESTVKRHDSIIEERRGLAATRAHHVEPEDEVLQHEAEAAPHRPRRLG